MGLGRHFIKFPLADAALTLGVASALYFIQRRHRGLRLTLSVRPKKTAPEGRDTAMARNSGGYLEQGHTGRLAPG